MNSVWLEICFYAFPAGRKTEVNPRNLFLLRRLNLIRMADMKWLFSLIIAVLMVTNCKVTAQPGKDSFTWGAVTYVNLSIWEKYNFHGEEIELLALRNSYNRLRVNHDTIWLKVCYRAPASVIGNLRIFIADNRNVKAIASDKAIHGLLKKDILLAVSPLWNPMIDLWQFIFPVSFKNGYIWRNDEDSYLFSYQGNEISKTEGGNQFAGVALELKNARESDKYGILAMESGKIMWIETKSGGTGQPKAALCLASDSFPGVYYIYQNLNKKYIFVKQNQKVGRGDELANMGGDGTWEYLQLGIVCSDSVPDYSRCSANLINFFPQLLELYYGRQPVGKQRFSKGQISFSISTGMKGNAKNVSAFEDYQGTGWKLDAWNTADKVEWVSNKLTGNARLSKTLFEGQPAQCTNPDDWYDYEIEVENGKYRVSSSVGDCFLPTWQKVEYEGVMAGTYQLNTGEFAWTPEKVVTVNDGKLTIRLYLADQTRKAGISKILFQQTD